MGTRVRAETEGAVGPTRVFQLSAHLRDVISAVLAVDGFDRADVQTPEHL